MSSNESNISEREWLCEATEMPRKTLLSCNLCDEISIGIEALREHICKEHLGYFPFACHHCERALPVTSLRQFEVHCKEEGHRRPYQWSERYNGEKEHQLHTETGEAVKRWMEAVQCLEAESSSECDINRVTIGKPEIDEIDEAATEKLFSAGDADDAGAKAQQAHKEAHEKVQQAHEKAHRLPE